MNLSISLLAIFFCASVVPSASAIVDFSDFNPGGFSPIVFDYELSLDSDNTNPRGITAHDNKLWVVDNGDDKVYVYNLDGTRNASLDFDLDTDNSSPTGITYFSKHFWILDGTDDAVYQYNSTRHVSASMTLPPANAQPVGITALDNKIWIADSDDSVYVYLSDGTPDLLSIFELSADNTGPKGITALDGKLWVVDPTDDIVYAYYPDGTPDPSADFALTGLNTVGDGITAHNDIFYVVDSTNTNYGLYIYEGAEIFEPLDDHYWDYYNVSQNVIDENPSFPFFYIVFTLILLAGFLIGAFKFREDRESIFFCISALICALLLAFMFTSTLDFDIVENEITWQVSGDTLLGVDSYSFSQTTNQIMIIPFDGSLRMIISLIFTGLAVFLGLYCMLIITNYNESRKLNPNR